VSKVFIVDTNKQPLDPIHPGWARKLLTNGKAAVYRRYPFTLILKEEVANPVVHPLRLKLDPGSKITGLAIVDEASGEIVFAAEIEHRGEDIKRALEKRRAVRRSRRQRKTRYRQARFKNRARQKGWLPPSLRSRLSNILTWVNRLRRLSPIAALSQELNRFDMQLMQNPEVNGVEYQQGELQGYEVREYLLEKWQRSCAYCGRQGIPLQVEHIRSRARGGTDRVDNLTLACEPCNRAKGTQDVRDFLQHEPETLARILAQAGVPLRDSAANNATRWALYEQLRATGLPVEVGTGGRTKYNRTQRGFPKTHWHDAACVGASTPGTLVDKAVKPLLIKATGHGRRQMCLVGRCGVPRSRPKRARKVHGFQTGDIVRAVIGTGGRPGTYVGRVAVRAKGYFNIATAKGLVQSIHYRHCAVLHKRDGYGYQQGVWCQ
jgi:5-methylcytosine-specific restriction endonuclease McrA